MPETLARTTPLTFLCGAERLTLNPIRGHGYLCLFGLVEEFILPFVMDHARGQVHGDEVQIRAFLEFAGEEAKHIHLFKRFRERFEDSFGTRCEVIGPPRDMARAVLSHHPLAVALTILHIEWMTQRHYLDSVRDDADLDPQFKSMLKHHWMEEAQHAKLDLRMIDTIAQEMSRRDIDGAMSEYVEIGGLLDDGLRQQVDFDLNALMRATGRVFSVDESEAFVAVQHQAQRWTFIGSGMTHRSFPAALEKLPPAARRRIEQIAPSFC